MQDLTLEELLARYRALEAEHESQGRRLVELEETIDAIRKGQVDALLMSGPEGHQVYTLSTAERPYRSMIEQMQQGAVILTANDHTILFANQRMADILNTRSETLIGKSFVESLASESRDTFLALTQNGSQGHASAEITLRSASGQSIPTLTSATSTGDNASTFALVVTDLTERKRLEEVEASESFSQLIFNQAADGIVICDPEGKVLRASQMAMKLCESTPIQRSFSDAFPLSYVGRLDEEGQLHEEMREDRRVRIPPALAVKYPYKIEAQLNRSHRPSVNVILNLGALRDSKGAFQGYIVTLTDITRLKEAQEHLRLSEEKFSKAFYGNASPMVITSLEDGRIIDANERCGELFGYARGEIIGRTTEELSIWQDSKERKRALDDLKKQGTLKNRECVFRTKEGESRTALCSAEIFRLREEPHALISFVDITKRKQAEDESRKTSAMLQAVLDSAPAGVIVTDSAGRIVISSKTAQSVSGGRLTGEIYGSTEGFTLCTSDGSPLSRDQLPLSRALKGDSLAGIELLLKRKDGTLFYILTNATPLEDTDGAVLGAVVVFQDITALKEVEIALRESQEQYESLFKAMNEGFAIHEIIYDENGKPYDYRICDMNPAAERLTGWKRGEALGKTKRELAPDGDSYWIENYCKVGDSGQPMHFEAYSSTFRKYFEVFAYSPVRGRCATVFTDISERRRMEADLREKEERLRFITTSTDYAVYDVDLLSRKIWWNDAYETLFDRPKSPEFGWNWWHEHIHPDDLGRVEKSSMAAAEGTYNQWSAEYRILRRDGTYGYFLDRAIFIRDSEGKATRMLGAMLDLSDRKRIEEALALAKAEAENANAAKSQFLANMSHEIRTPLSAILGFSELLAEPKLTDQERQEYSEIISKSGIQLSTLINDILDLAKVESGRFDLELERVSIVNLLEDVRRVVDIKAREKSVAFEIRAGWVPAGISSNAARLQQILTNVIGNAIKFTPSGGSVWLYVETDKNTRSILFSVTDTGIGIALEHQSKIFKPFAQAKSDTARDFGGTGLGLTLSRRLAENLGGELFLEKSVPGQGSTFVVRIPATGIDEMFIDDRTLPPKEIIAGDRLKGLHTLLVEDTENNIAFISRFLTKKGALVDIARNGKEALQKALTNHYNIILMDVRMPVMDGISATQELRARGCKIPIIAMTAHAMKGDREPCLAAGMNSYISKPINSLQLVKTIEELVQEPDA